VTIHGTVHGGQQPVVGAHIYVMTPNNPNYGPGSASLLMLNGNVLTDEPANSGSDGSGNYYVTTASDGSFSINFGNDYDCGDGYDAGEADDFSLSGNEPVYLYAVGGDPGAGVNAAAGFLASLGPCSGISNSTSVQMNEMTTVAMAYAVAGYAQDATDINSSSSALAATGIGNAFANTTNLVDLSSGQPLATTPTINGGNGTVPTAEITTLANILAACVNTADVYVSGVYQSPSSACSTLLSTATSDGTSGGANPTDTASAAINIAHNPSANVMTLFDSTPTNPAFGGGLTNQPNDFTIALTFTGGGIQPTVDAPHDLAIDAGGNAWSASDVLSEFSPLGVASTYGAGSGAVFVSAHGVAVSADSTQIWIPDNQNHSVTDFAVNGAMGVSYDTGSGSHPYDIAIDGSGYLYMTDPFNSRLIQMDPGGNLVGSATGSGLNVPSSVSVQAGLTGNGDLWVANFQANNASVFTNGSGSGPTALTADSSGGVTHAIGSAIDSNGFVWMANQNNTVSKLDSNGTSGGDFTIPNNAQMDGLAIDGGGNVWATDAINGTVVELNNAGALLTGPNGYKPVNGDYPDAIAVDGSGDVWYTNQTTNSLYELIGAGVPVVTPLAYGVVNSLLGQQP
jgi:streptogramin lyase